VSDDFPAAGSGQAQRVLLAQVVNCAARSRWRAARPRRWSRPVRVGQRGNGRVEATRSARATSHAPPQWATIAQEVSLRAGARGEAVVRFPAGVAGHRERARAGVTRTWAGDGAQRSASTSFAPGPARPGLRGCCTRRTCRRRRSRAERFDALKLSVARGDRHNGCVLRRRIHAANALFKAPRHFQKRCFAMSGVYGHA